MSDSCFAGTNLALTGFTEMHRKKPVKICGICENLYGRITKRTRLAFVTCLHKQLRQSKSATQPKINRSYQGWQHKNFIPSLAASPNDVHTLLQVLRHLRAPNYRERNLENQPVCDAAMHP